MMATTNETRPPIAALILSRLFLIHLISIILGLCYKLTTIKGVSSFLRVEATMADFITPKVSNYSFITAY